MILGIDAGTSAVKLAVLDGDRICTTYYQSNCDTSAHTLQQALERSGIRSLPITHVAVTGLNGSRCGADALGLPLCKSLGKSLRLALCEALCKSIVPDHLSKFCHGNLLLYCG